jgi:glutathione S-transferase/RNA polymerase-associated protein
MLRLYEHPFSPYAAKVKIALREKAVAFEPVQPERNQAGDPIGEYVEANPRVEVPALIDGEVKIFDSTIILEYIEDKWPTPPMLPKSPAERARVRMLEEVMDTHYEPINWGLSEIRSFGRATGALAEMLEKKAAAQIASYYAWLEKQLGDREWFNGDDFGWGDLAVVPFLNGTRGHGHRPAADSKLGAWMKRANARPSVAAGTKDITDLLAAGQGIGNAAEMVEKGLMKREYRDHRLEWMIKLGGMEVITKGLERGNIRFGPDFD